MQIVIGEPDGGTTLTGYVGDQMVTSRGDFGEFVFDLPPIGDTCTENWGYAIIDPLYLVSLMISI